MPARVPQDVDLEDRLVFNLTAIQFGYLVIGALAAGITWKIPWAPAPVRLLAVAPLALCGVALAWGRWQGRPLDAWTGDGLVFLRQNLRLRWRPTGIAGALRTRCDATPHARPAHLATPPAIASAPPGAPGAPRMIEVHLLHGPLRPLLPAIPDAQVLTTGAIGFLDAAAEDRERWSRGFRQLLDGLDAPLQVVIDVAVGDGDPELPPTVLPDLGAASLVERRALDLAHAAALRALPTAQRRVVSLVTTPAAAQLVERGLQLLGVPQVTRSIATAAAAGSPRGVESPTGWWDETGLYRTWFLDRFPGHDLDPGWLLRLVPAGLEISLAWHAERLATAGVVEYLQRQLIRLRARQLDRGDVGEPEVEGALPAVERLQRQLMARQEQAFHVSLYLTVRTHGPRQLAHAATQIEAAAPLRPHRPAPCHLPPA